MVHSILPLPRRKSLTPSSVPARTQVKLWGKPYLEKMQNTLLSPTDHLQAVCGALEDHSRVVDGSWALLRCTGQPLRADIPQGFAFSSCFHWRAERAVERKESEGGWQLGRCRTIAAGSFWGFCLLRSFACCSSLVACNSVIPSPWKGDACGQGNN